MGTGQPRPSGFPNGRAIRLHPRSQPADSSVGRRARRPPRELSLAARMHWRTWCKAAPIRRTTRAQRACRAARAHGSVRACEWHGERSNRPALTRPTGCGRAVVVAPARAAIRARVRFARRLGTAWRRPLPAGLHDAPSPQAASFGRGGGVTGCGRRKSHPLSTPPLTTESPTTHTTDQHHVPMDPRAAELMPIHAARLALTRSVTQKAVDPSMGPALRVRLTARAASARAYARSARRPALAPYKTCEPEGHPAQILLDHVRARPVRASLTQLS